MSYVFFDLEWNQGYPRSEVDKLDEIIQFGAYQLKDWQAEGVAFSAYVRPTIHKKLHHRVRKMLPLDQKDLLRAQRFPEVADTFFHWCGPDARFFTWGPSDAKVLDLNLAWYGMEQYLSIDVYDLQRAFDLMIMGSDQQTALKDAVEKLGLQDELEFHDACNDAYYTARIGAEMVRLLGRLPTAAELKRREQELYHERRAKAAQAALDELDRIFDEADALLERVGLADKVHEPVKNLSGGQKQRVAIARALMRHPALLLADEPVASLDPVTGRQILELLRDIQQDQKLTVLMNSHNLELSQEFSSRLIGLNQGAVVLDAPADTPAKEILSAVYHRQEDQP